MNSIEFKRYSNLIWLLPLWLIQYTFAYTIWMFKLTVGIFKFGLNLGVIGLILLFVPFFGWIILAFWMLNKPSSSKPSMQLRPWFLEKWKKDAE